MSLDPDILKKLKAKLKKLEKELPKVEGEDYNKTLSHFSYLNTLIENATNQASATARSAVNADLEVPTLEKYEEVFGPISKPKAKPKESPAKAKQASKTASENKPDPTKGKRKALADRSRQIKDYISTVEYEQRNLLKLFSKEAAKDEKFEQKLTKSIVGDLKGLLEEKKEIDGFLVPGKTVSTEETADFLKTYKKEFGELSERPNLSSKSEQLSNVVQQLEVLEEQFKSIKRPGPKAEDSVKQQYKTYKAAYNAQKSDILSQFKSTHPDLFNLLAPKQKPAKAKSPNPEADPIKEVSDQKPTKKRAARKPKNVEQASFIGDLLDEKQEPSPAIVDAVSTPAPEPEVPKTTVTPKVKKEKEAAEEAVEKIAENAQVSQLKEQTEIANAVLEEQATKPRPDRKAASLKGLVTKAKNKFGESSSEYAKALSNLQDYLGTSVKEASAVQEVLPATAPQPEPPIDLPKNPRSKKLGKLRTGLRLKNPDRPKLSGEELEKNREILSKRAEARKAERSTRGYRRKRNENRLRTGLRLKNPDRPKLSGEELEKNREILRKRAEARKAERGTRAERRDSLAQLKSDVLEKGPLFFYGEQNNQKIPETFRPVLDSITNDLRDTVSIRDSMLGGLAGLIENNRVNLAKTFKNTNEFKPKKTPKSQEPPITDELLENLAKTISTGRGVIVPPVMPLPPKAEPLKRTTKYGGLGDVGRATLKRIGKEKISQKNIQKKIDSIFEEAGKLNENEIENEIERNRRLPFGPELEDLIEKRRSEGSLKPEKLYSAGKKAKAKHPLDPLLSVLTTSAADNYNLAEFTKKYLAENISDFDMDEPPQKPPKGKKKKGGSGGGGGGTPPRPPGSDPEDADNIDKSAEALEKQNKGIRSFGGLMNSIVGDFFLISQLSYTFADIGATLAGVFTQANAELEVYLTTLKSTLGTAGKAENVFYNFAQAFALQVPFFETQDLISTVNKLAAEGFRGVQLTGNLDPAKGAKFEGSLVKSITDLASAFGKSPDQAVDAFISAAQNRFVRIRQFGISREDLKTFGFSGTADDSQGAVSALRQIIDLRYGGITETLGQTFKGAKSNIDDFLKTMSRLATKPAFDSVTSFMVEAINYINLFEEGLSKAEGTFKSRASQNFVRYLEEDIGGALKKVADTILGFIRFLGENSAAALGLAGLSVTPLIGKTLKGTGGAIVGSLGGLKEGIFGKPKYGPIGAAIASFFGGKGLANNPNFNTPEGPTKAGRYFEHAKKRGDFSSMVRFGLQGAKNPTGLSKIGVTAALVGLEKYGMQLNNAYAGMTRLGAAGAKTFASLTGFLNIAVPILKVVFIGALFEAAGAMSDLRKGIEDTGRAMNLKSLASSLKEQEKIVIQIFKNIANAFGATLGEGPESGAFLYITNAFVSITNQGLKAAELITSAFSGVGATIRKLFSNVKSGLGSAKSIIPNIFKAGGDATKPIGKGFSALYGGSSLTSEERNASMYGTSAALGGLWAAGSMVGQYAKSAGELELTKRFFTSSALKQAQNLGVVGAGRTPLTLTISSATITIASAAFGAFAAYTAGRESGDMNDVLFAERQNVFGEKTLWDYTDIGSEAKAAAAGSVGKFGRLASYTATGALMGTAVPILGTGLGAMLGGIVGLGAETFNLGKEAEMEKTANDASGDLQAILRSRRSAVLGQYALPALLGGAGALGGSYIAPVAGTVVGGAAGTAAGVGLNNLLANSPLRFLVEDTADTKTFEKQLVSDGIRKTVAERFGKSFRDSNIAGLLAEDSDNAEVADALDKILKPLEAEKELVRKSFEEGDIGSELFEKQNNALDKHIKKWTDLRDEISAYGDLTKFRNKDLEESLAVDEKSLKSSNDAVDAIEKSFEEEEQEFVVIENQIRQASFSGQDTSALRAQKDQMRAEQIQKTIARTNELGGIQLGIDATLSSRQEEKKVLQKEFEEERKKLEGIYATEDVAENLGITSKKAQNSLANAVSKYISGDTKNARSEIQGVLKREGVSEEESNKFLFQLVRDSGKAFDAKGRLETVQNFLNKQSEVSKNASKLFSDLVSSISASIQQTNEAATTNYEAGIITIAKELEIYEGTLQQLLSVDTLAATEETKKQQALVKRKQKQFREAFRGRGLEGEILSQPLSDATRFTQDFNKVAKDLNTQTLSESFRTLNVQVNSYNKLLSLAVPETDQYRQISENLLSTLKEMASVYDQIIDGRRKDIETLKQLQFAQEDVAFSIEESAIAQQMMNMDFGSTKESLAGAKAQMEILEAKQKTLETEKEVASALRESQKLQDKLAAIQEDTALKASMRRRLADQTGIADLANTGVLRDDSTRQQASELAGSYASILATIRNLEQKGVDLATQKAAILTKENELLSKQKDLMQQLAAENTKRIQTTNSIYEQAYRAQTGQELNPVKKQEMMLREAMALKREFEVMNSTYATADELRQKLLEFNTKVGDARQLGRFNKYAETKFQSLNTFGQVAAPNMITAATNRKTPLQKELEQLTLDKTITDAQKQSIEAQLKAVQEGAKAASAAREEIQKIMPTMTEKQSELVDKELRRAQVSSSTGPEAFSNATNAFAQAVEEFKKAVGYEASKTGQVNQNTVLSEQIGRSSVSRPDTATAMLPPMVVKADLSVPNFEKLDQQLREQATIATDDSAKRIAERIQQEERLAKEQQTNLLAQIAKNTGEKQNVSLDSAPILNKLDILIEVISSLQYNKTEEEPEPFIPPQRTINATGVYSQLPKP